MTDSLHEAFGHFADLLGGGEAIAEMRAHEARDACGGGELGDVGVEVHAIDALQFHDDIFPLEFGDVLWQIHSGIRLGFCSSNLWRDRRLSAKIRSRNCGTAPPDRIPLLF